MIDMVEGSPDTEQPVETVADEKSVSEATENTEGQDQEDQPAGDKAEEADDPDKKTATQSRRERRKAKEIQYKEEADAARKEAAAHKARAERILGAAKGEPPKEADFNDPLEYAAALGAFKARQMGSQFDADQFLEDAKNYEGVATTLEEKQRQEQVKDFLEQKEQAKARYADLDQVLAVAQRNDIVSDDLAGMILESDLSVDLAYHLGKNPAVARSISALPPLQAARELGKIEARLTAPQARTQSAAPSPITPVKGSGTVTKDPSKMTATEYNKWRESGGTF